ncbi:hypothetical protein ACERK3_01635 [Phycisphaerales bacterium AB-hyl4]|uniref:DUF3604 domain-containing protein n=1 Tax=Natronomicrosphaera hydrolytica TaxID=3242702 RepID=A0ABV4U067_9BACT
MKVTIAEQDAQTVLLKLDEAVPAGSLLRIRGSNSTMFRNFRVAKAWLEDSEQPLSIEHRFSYEEMQADWKLHARLKSLAVLKTETHLSAGAGICVNMEPTTAPLAAPGIKGQWVLERITNLQDTQGRVISHDVEVTFTEGPRDSTAVHQNARGDLWVREYDAFGYPRTASANCSILKRTPLEGSRRYKAILPEGDEVVSDAMPRAMDGTPIYFGDFHWHTEFSDGQQSLEKTLAHARDCVGLDFAGPGDHMGITGRFGDRAYAEQASICRQFDDPERFCTLPAVELSFRQGHVHLVAKNFDVMGYLLKGFPDAVRPDFQSQPHRLPWRAILKHCPKGQSMLSPCHPITDSGGVVNPEDGRVVWYSFNWPRAVEYDLTRIVEIIREGRSQETEQVDENWRSSGSGLGGSVRTALTRGYRVGFSGRSDSHVGWPGRGGITAVQTSVLNTTSIFQALHSRRCYATSGARIVADATLNDHPMGSELQLDPDAQRLIRIRIQGTAPIVQVQIISAGVVVADLPAQGGSLDYEGEWVDQRPGRHLENVYYYVRVRQSDGHCAWLSPFWIDLPSA